MATFKAKNRAEVNRALREIQKRTEELVKGISGSSMTKTLFNAVQIVEARAKEILTEKGHIVTGNLRRSINTSIVENSAKVSRVQVGSFVEYAPFVEALPDGGFLYPAVVETFDQVSRYMVEHGLAPAIKNWGGRERAPGPDRGPPGPLRRPLSPAAPRHRARDDARLARLL